jgi:hypothetical protein
MENKSPISHQPIVFVSILLGTVGILAALTLMAGLPQGDGMVWFIFGAIVLILFLAGLGTAVWHLLVRPLPENLKVPTKTQLLTTRARHVIALFLTLGTFSVGIAGVWDEIWHSKYGIPFGEDFFWRPHIMLYFSFGTLIVTALWSWWQIMNKGKGTLQQRFHIEPLMGVNFFIGAFTVFALGADPLWHRLYGRDLAPWSLPHMLILMLILMMGLLTISYHKSLLPLREWQFKPKVTGRDVLIAFALVGVLLTWTLIFTIQWYGAASGSENQILQIARYPDWLFSVFITFLATFFGVTALHATRQIGIATLLGVLTLAARFLLDNGFSGVRVGTQAMWIMLPIMLALDLWYAFSVYRTKNPPVFWTAAIAAAIGYGTIGLVLQANLLPYPVISMGNIPGMIIAGGLSAAVGVWLGQMLGSMNRYGHEVVEGESGSQTAGLTTRWMYIAFAAATIFWVVTATPPA